MAKMRADEHILFAKYIGEHINAQRLKQVTNCTGLGNDSYYDSEEYVVSRLEQHINCRQMFKLTTALIDRWRQKDVDFQIFIYVCDGRIAGGHICKYVGVPSRYETDPNQQELRIVSRVLSYITSEVD